MFKDSKAFSSYSIDDPQKAKAFYGQVLGLEVTEVPGMEGEGLLQIALAGGGHVMLYPKPDHRPATFTVLNFPIDDVDNAVDRLTAKGVRFESYDQEDLKTDAKGVSRHESLAMAWFKDPAGNILSVISGKPVAHEEALAAAGSSTEG